MPPLRSRHQPAQPPVARTARPFTRIGRAFSQLFLACVTDQQAIRTQPRPTTLAGHSLANSPANWALAPRPCRFGAFGANLETVSVAQSRAAREKEGIAVRKYLVLSVLGACLLVLVPGTAAFAGGSTYYAGKNSQGQKLFFSVDQTARGPAFDPFFTNMVDRCPATGTKFTIQFTFMGFQIPLKNGKFDLTLNNLSDRFSWSGTVTPKKATGTESYALAAFNNTGGLQDCATGALSWTAPALLPASSKAAAPRAEYTVTITKARDGAVHFLISH
jgi:hypothetical protein